MKRTLLTTVVGLGRLVTGLWFLSSPARPAWTWVGNSSTDTQYLTRAVGGRDAAIGAGTLIAQATGGSAAIWLAASVASDCTDAGASLPMLRPTQRRKALAYAGGFGLLGLIAWWLEITRSSK